MAHVFSFLYLTVQDYVVVKQPHLRQVLLPAVRRHRPPQFPEQLHVKLDELFGNWKTDRNCSFIQHSPVELWELPGYHTHTHTQLSHELQTAPGPICS